MERFRVGSFVPIVQSGFSPASAQIIRLSDSEISFSFKIRMLPGWRAALEDADGKVQVEVLWYDPVSNEDFVIRAKFI